MSHMRRWLPLALGVLTFVVVLAGLSAIAGDWVARNAEMRALVTRIEQSESAMGDLQSQVQEVAASYQDKLPLNATDQAALDAQLQAIAVSSDASIKAAGDAVADVHWLVWHRDVAAAQRAYLAHNQAWQDYLTRASTDPSEFAKQQDDIDSTFGQAEIDVRAALPVPALYGLRDRIDVIFAPPPLPEGSGQAA